MIKMSDMQQATTQAYVQSNENIILQPTSSWLAVSQGS